MTHLGGAAVTALVDGEVDHETRERMLVHLTGCPACRGEVDDARGLKLRLAELTAPSVPDELAERLRSLDRSAAVAESSAPASSSWPRWPSGRRLRRSLVGGASVAVCGLAAATAVGAPPVESGEVAPPVESGEVAAPVESGEVAPPVESGKVAPQAGEVAPRVAAFLAEYAATSSEVPLTDPVIGAAISVSSSR